MDAADTIQALVGSLGLADAQPDERGACGLVFEEEIHLTLEPDPQRPTLMHCHASLGTLPANGERRRIEELLRANYLGAGAGGAIFSIDGAKDEVVLDLCLDVAVSDLGEISRRLAAFVGEVGQWAERFGDGSGAASGCDSAGEASDATSHAFDEFPDPFSGDLSVIRI